MTRGQITVRELAEEQLAAALPAQVGGGWWVSEAGIGLLVARSVWLRRPEFRWAAGAWQDGRDAAGVDRPEAGRLRGAGFVVGDGGSRPGWFVVWPAVEPVLSWLPDLGERNSALAAGAVRHACSGPGKGLVR